MNTSFRLGLLGLLAVSFVSGCRHLHATDEAASSALIGRGDAEPELTTPAFPGWASACGEGDAGACHRLYSTILHSARHDVAHLPETMAGFERGCEAGLGDACGGAALTRAILKVAMPEAATFEQACRLGSPWSCALHFTLEFEGADDHQAQTKLFHGALARCQSRGDVCAVISEVSMQSADAPRWDRMLRVGCELGDSFSCFQLGRAPSVDASNREIAGMEVSKGHDPTPGVPSPQEARSLLTLACDDDIGPACHLLALHLFRGEGGQADPSEGRARSHQACELGAREACDFLAQTRGGRTFPPPEGAKAYPDASAFVPSQRRYCELGGHQACIELAKVRLQEATAAPNLDPIDEGLGLLVRTCEQRNEEACQVILSVIGTATSTCNGTQDANGCLVAGAVWRRGLRVPATLGENIDPAPARAREAFTLACEAGMQAGCSELNSVLDGDTTSN